MRGEPLTGVEDREVAGHRESRSLVIIERTSSYFGKMRSPGSIFSGIMMGLNLYFNRISPNILLRIIYGKA